MANKVLKGISFPGLANTYTVPEAVAVETAEGCIEIQSYISDTIETEITNLDTTLTKEGLAADAAEVGKILNQKIDKTNGKAQYLTVADSLTIKRGNQAEGAYFYTYVDDHDYPTVELLGTANDDFVKLYGIANPTDANDAVNKQYVDTNFAPAGLVNGIYYVTSLADFESRIEEVYNSMENCTERVIQMDLTSGTAEVHSGDWYITIVRRSANNGFLRMTKSLDSVVSHQRYRYDGSWGPWTWETPLMKPGVEYRTTERWQGKPVYAKLVDFGHLPNTTEKRVAFTKDGERVQVVSLNGRAYEDDGEGVYFLNYSEGFPFYANGSLQADAYTGGDLYSDRTAIIVNAHTNCTMFYAMFVVKYVKE